MVEVKNGNLILHNSSKKEVFVTIGQIDILEPCATGTRVFCNGSNVDVIEGAAEIAVADYKAVNGGEDEQPGYDN